MNKKLCAYLSLLVLLGATFCTPAIAVAEMVSNIEVESQTSQSNSPATDTKTEESTTTSENAESTSQTVEDTSNSQPEKATTTTTTETSTSELNQNTIQPSAPTEDSETESTEQAVTPNAVNPDLNARGIQLFDNVRITDMNDQPFDQNNPPYYNDNIKIHFDWSLSVQEEIKNGDYYIYQLPSYFAVHNEVSGTLQRSGGGIIRRLLSKCKWRIKDCFQ